MARRTATGLRVVLGIACVVLVVFAVQAFSAERLRSGSFCVIGAYMAAVILAWSILADPRLREFCNVLCSASSLILLAAALFGLAFLGLPERSFWALAGLAVCALVAAYFTREAGTAKGQEPLQRAVDPPAGTPATAPPAVSDDVRVSTAKLPTTGELLYGRDDELALLDSAWGDDGTHIVSFFAWGGVGKTALVKRWLGHLSQGGYRGAARVYGYSFYSQGAKEGGQASADQFVAHALEWFDGPKGAELAQSPVSAWEKGEKLAELVAQERTLLVLDGLEPLQRPANGQLKDPALCCLLKQLAGRNPGLCVLTTRLAVEELGEWTDTTVRRKRLKRLPVPAAVELLRELGCEGTDAELRETAEEFDCHALALTLLGRYLAVRYHGDVRERDRVPKLTVERDQGGHARRVMESYEKWLSGTAELAVLRLMGLFDRPAVAGAIEALRAEPPIPGLTEPLSDISERQWKYALRDLRKHGLLAPEDDEEPGALDCHPLIRKHFADRLRETAPEAWTEAHGRLYEYYRSVPEVEQPDTIEGLAPLYGAVAHGCAAGLYQEALHEVYYPRVCRQEEYYAVNKLGAFGADLTAVSAFFEEPWNRPAASLRESDKAFLLNQAACWLRALGRLEEALEPMDASAQRTIEPKRWDNAARGAGNLSELCLTMGDVEGAVAYAERSVQYAERSRDKFVRLYSRTTLADALHQAGRVGEAEELFEEAERMQAEREPQYPLLYSLQGCRYCDLLLARGEYDEVLDRARQTLEWAASAGGSLLTIALDKLSLGRAHALRPEGGDSAEARRQLDEAVAGLRQAGDRTELPRGLLARAAFFRQVGEFKSAKHDLDEALTIATRGSMRLWEADCRLEYARLFLETDRRDEARGHYEKAAEMVEEMGYHRRDEEVEELRGQLS
ncbi:MAG: tetratricopeptide repeat protein [Candidatus Brocadiia bacterium]